MITKLNNYIGSKGKKYKSHYHTILNWSRRDIEQKKTNTDKYGNPQKDDVSNIDYNITDVLDNDNVTIKMRRDYCDKLGINMNEAPSDETILQYNKL